MKPYVSRGTPIQRQEVQKGDFIEAVETHQNRTNVIQQLEVGRIVIDYDAYYYYATAPVGGIDNGGCMRVGTDTALYLLERPKTKRQCAIELIAKGTMTEYNWGVSSPEYKMRRSDEAATIWENLHAQGLVEL